jgi:hypothetical protein
MKMDYLDYSAIEEAAMTQTTTVKILTAFNVIISCLLFGSLLMGAKADSPTVRARALELIDERGTVRGQWTVESSGEVVLRLRDEQGAIRVKVGAGAGGSGLVLLDETTAPGVQIIARRVPKDGQASTGITVSGAGGSQARVSPN